MKRRSRSFSDSGKQVKKTKTSDFASVLKHCKCADCWSSPGPTGLPTMGRYVTEAVFKVHRSAQRKQESLLLHSQFIPAADPVALTSSSLYTADKAPLTSSSVSDNLPYYHAPFPTIIVNHAGPSIDDEALSNKIVWFMDHIRDADEVVGETRLRFRTAPTSTSCPVIGGESHQPGVLDLDAHVESNRVILGFEEFLKQAGDLALEAKRSANARRVQLQAIELETLIDSRSERLARIKHNQWEQQRLLEVSQRPVFDTAPYYAQAQALLSFPPSILVCYLLAATHLLLCGLSLDRTQFTLTCLNLIVHLTTTSPSLVPFTPPMPTDARTVLNHLFLEPESEAYACCPTCFSIYWLNPNDPAALPDTCTRQEADNPMCAAKLKIKRVIKKVEGRGKDKDKVEVKEAERPARTYHYQGLNSWVGRLYCRPDLQKYLRPDSEPISGIQSSAEAIPDILQSPGLQSFLGPDGKPFLKDANEGRLVFSLNMDGFNPYTNKEAGKKVSMGAIYIACLNLPPSIRFNPENIYLVAVIPGPYEPSTHQINYLLKPLVDDLLVSWSRGIYYTKVLGFPNGLLVRCALVPLVCDLPAARQMSGAAHFSHTNFCSYCKLKLEDIGNFECEDWVPRTSSEFRSAAKGWRDATTQVERDQWYKQHGVRWSELLRLPYWNPIEFTVIDSMHAFYLRIFSRHVRSIWGIDAALPDGDGVSFMIKSGSKPPTEDEMENGYDVLSKGTKVQVTALSLKVLRTICRNTGTVAWKGTKTKIVERLLEYRSRCNGDVYPSESRTGLKTSKGLGVDDIFLHASKSQLSSTQKKDLFCILLAKDPTSSLAEIQHLTNAELVKKIQALRHQAGLIDSKGKVIGKQESKKGTCVLGRSTLAEIRADIGLTRLPSWASAPPSHPGETKWGKLTADQWRTLCLVSLPITLVRLWGRKSEDSREFRMLTNYMHLVSAVKYATKRNITATDVELYEREMHTHLSTLLDLYPGASISPYHHLSLHFGSFLRRFGPTSGWRCFPFERYNAIMQQVQNNGHLGEMAKTLFDRFITAQNLRQIIHPARLPGFLKPLIDSFRQAFKSGNRETIQYDALLFNEQILQKDGEMESWTAADMTTLHPDTYKLLSAWVAGREPSPCGKIQLSDQGYVRSSITRLGQKFQTSNTSFIDSLIIFNCDRKSWTWAAGSIREIFSHSRCRHGKNIIQTFVVVRPYAELRHDQTSEDAYRNFPAVCGRSFRDIYLADVVLSIQDVLCHFVRYPSRPGCLLALPLDRDLSIDDAMMEQ